MKQRSQRLLLSVVSLSLGLALIVLWFRSESDGQSPGVRADGRGDSRLRDASAATVWGEARGAGDPADSSEATTLDAAADSTTDPTSRDTDPAPASELDPVQCILHGRVTDDAGEPIRDWQPYITLADEKGERLFVKAGDDGFYSISGIAPREWSFSCNATGYRAQEESLQFSIAEPILRKDVVLQRAVVLPIRVVDVSGRPFMEVMRKAQSSGRLFFAGRASFLPVATVDTPGATMEEAQRIHNDQLHAGAFWDYGPPMEGLGPPHIGVLVLTVDLPVHVSLVYGSLVLATHRVASAESGVEFALSIEGLQARLGRIRMRILDAATNEPLRARVSFQTPQSSLDGVENLADGTIDIDGVAPADYTIRIVANGYETTPIQGRVEAGRTLDLGDVLRVRALSMGGRVVDAEGKPVLGQFIVEPRDPTTRRPDFDRRNGFFTQNDGTFVLDGLRPDRYFVRSYGTDERTYPGTKEETLWVSGFIEVSTVAGSIDDLEIRLVRPALITLLGSETLAEGCRFRLVEAHGYTLRSRRHYRGSVPQWKVPPGAYKLVLADSDGKDVASREITVVEGVNEIELPR